MKLAADVQNLRDSLKNVRAHRKQIMQQRQRALDKCKKLYGIVNEFGDLFELKRTLAEEAAKVARESNLLGSKRMLKRDLQQQKRRLKHHTLRLNTPSQKIQQLKKTVTSLRTKVDEFKSTALGAIER